MKEFLYTKSQFAALINLGGVTASVMAWLHLLNPLIGFLAGVIGLVAGFFLMVKRFHDWKREKTGWLYRVGSSVFGWERLKK